MFFLMVMIISLLQVILMINFIYNTEILPETKYKK